MNDETNLARVLQTLDLIQTHPGIGAQDIGRRLGVTTRAVRRSVATLRDAGFTIGSTPGPAGGYRIQRGPRMPLVFSQEELAALAMSLVESSSAMADEAATTAASKVLQGLPTRIAAPAQSVLETATIVANRTHGPAPSVVLQLATAIEQARRVQIDYRAAGDTVCQPRTVEPWGLVVRHRHWYLMGHNPHRHSTRTYRVDRIERVDVSVEGFSPPEGLDVASAFEDHLQKSWTSETCVDIGAPTEVAQEWIPFTMGTLIPSGPDSCQIQGRTNNCESYITDLLQTPLNFSVRGGPELLDAVNAIRTRLQTAP